MRSTLHLVLLVLSLAIAGTSAAQPTCPPGQMVTSAGTCAFPPAGSQGTCPTATVADGAGGCVAITCPAGQTLTSAGACAFPPAGSQGMCAAGTVADGAGGCVASACPPGQMHTSAGACAFPPAGSQGTCAAGTVADGAGGCKRQSVVAAQSLPTPMLAGVTSDGEKISFAWYAVKGTTSFEIEQSPDAQNATRVASVSSTTLGGSVALRGPGPTYYRLVAVGANGARGVGAWFLYWAPTITSVVANGADVVLKWSGVKSAPGGYEIWRTPNPKAPQSRVGAVSSSTLTYRDKQAGPGPFYYHVIAIGAGGTRAASAWYQYGTARAAATAPAPPPAPATLGAATTRTVPALGAAVPPAPAPASKQQVAQADDALETLIDKVTVPAGTGEATVGASSGGGATSTSTYTIQCNDGGYVTVATAQVGNVIKNDMVFVACRNGSDQVYGNMSRSVTAPKTTGGWPTSGSLSTSATISAQIAYESTTYAGNFTYNNFSESVVLTRNPTNISATRTMTGTIGIGGTFYTFNGESYTSTLPLR